MEKITYDTKVWRDKFWQGMNLADNVLINACVVLLTFCIQIYFTNI